MADVCDTADLEVEAGVTLAMARAKAEERPPTGRCFFCKEKVPAGEKYCNDECREEFVYYDSIRRKQFAK